MTWKVPGIPNPRSIPILRSTRKLSHFGLRAWLAFTFCAMALLLSGILSWLIGETSTRRVERQIGRGLAELAYQMQDKLDRGMFERYRNIQIAASLEILLRTEMSREARRAWLETLQSTFPYYAWIGLTDIRGTVMIGTGGLLEGKNISARPWFSEGLQRPYVGDVHEALLLAGLLDQESAEPPRFVDIAAPVTDRNGMNVGVLAAHLSWDWAEEVRLSVLEPIEERRDIQLLVLNKNGTVLMGPAELKGQTLSLRGIAAAQQTQSGYLAERWPDNETYLTGYSRSDGYLSYPGLGWVVLARQDVDLAYEPAYSLQRWILLWGAGVGVLFAMLGWWLAGRLAAPLAAITEAADQIRRGDTATRIPRTLGYAEIVRLSISLRALVGALTRHEAELEAANRLLEQRVRERTQNLSEANQALQAEIQERRRVEHEREQLIAELRELAETDSLTGALNRRSFFMRGNHEILRAKRLGRPLAAIMLDIDHFKRVNDTYGHGVGDEVIRHVAGCCRANLREIDLIGRYGGEEFAILITEADAPTAERLAERLRSAVADMRISAEKEELRITASLGLAVLGPECADLATLLQCADAALYQAKRSGRNRVVAV